MDNATNIDRVRIAIVMLLVWVRFEVHPADGVPLSVTRGWVMSRVGQLGRQRL
jgi:hypothetical protein